MLIYLIVGGFSLFLALMSFLFAEIGDVFHDVSAPISDWADSHLSFGHDHEIGFSRFLNNGGILGFLAGFGFIAALSMSQFNATAFVAALWGILGGLVIGGFMGVFWFVLGKSEGTAGYNIDQLVGQEGVVTEKIYQGSLGRVACVINGMRVWHTAKNEDGAEILPGTTVKITRVTGSILYVIPETSGKKS